MPSSCYLLQCSAFLQFPHWLAFIPILISLALLALAALLTLRAELAAARR